MKKILMLSTGGTIASTPSENGLAPTVRGDEMTAKIPALKNICEITCIEVFSLDSSNIQPEEWTRLTEEVRKQENAYDGFVITHGTDTMAYTAAALSYSLQGIKKPVILTGSQLPMEDAGTDGIRNMTDAFVAAADGRLFGVYIVFDGIVICGTCAKKVCTKDYHGFVSVNVPDAGHIEDGKLVLGEKNACMQCEKNVKNVTTRKVTTGKMITPGACFDDCVLLIKLYPGIRPEVLMFAKENGYRAVVLEGFGLGGIPNVNRNLLPAILDLLENGILVIATTQCLYEGCDLSVYDVGQTAAKAGVLSAGEMTTEAILTKLMWIFGQTKDPEIARKMFE